MDHQLFRIKSVGTKVTTTEFELLKDKAQADGQTLSEWTREVLLHEARELHPNLDLVSEIVGLQLLIMNVLAPLARGERITTEQFQAIVRSVQSTKVKAAQEMLARRREPKEI
jgi:hypothetical protein